MTQLSARKYLKCDFDTTIGTEVWHIDSAYRNTDGEIVWYNGHTLRGNKKYYKMLNPRSVRVPKGFKK
jgi:hypothetical protein